MGEKQTENSWKGAKENRKGDPKPAMKNQKANLRPVPSSIRGKKRYVLFSLQSEARLRANDVNDALWKVLLRLFGENGVGEMKYWLVLWDEKKGEGIARCSEGTTEKLKEGLLFLKEVTGQNVVPKTIKVSGSIAKLKKEL